MAVDDIRTLHDMDVDAYLYDSVTIDPVVDLDDQFRGISAAVAYWNARYADAIEANLKAELEHKRTNAQLYMQHREDLELDKGKVTEGMVKAAVEQDQLYLETKIESIETEAHKVRMRGVCEAVSSKKDMLQSLGAKLRAEMSGDPVLRAQIADAAFQRTQD